MSSPDYGHPDRMSPQELELARCQIAVAKAYPDMKGGQFNGLLNRLLSDIPVAVQARAELEKLTYIHPISDSISEIAFTDSKRVTEILDNVL